MGEAHQHITFQNALQNREDRLMFYHKPQAMATIWQSAKNSWRMTLKQRYNRLSKSIYPYKATSLGLWFGLAGSLEFENNRVPLWIASLHSRSVSYHRSFFYSIGHLFSHCHNTLSTIPVIGDIYSKIFDLTTAPIRKILKTISETVNDQYVLKFCSVVSWWLMSVWFTQWVLRNALSYNKFLFENPRKGYSLKTKLFFGLLKLVRGKPRLYHCQAALPSLPVPNVRNSVDRWLESVKPICSDEEYIEYNDLANEFVNGVGPRLQRYVKLKAFLTDNYVSDWWEQFIYLRSRAPIMGYSNYYGIGRLSTEKCDELFSKNQSAAAANIISCLLEWRKDLETEKLEPQAIAGVRPLCMSQYSRLFNVTRVPELETTDVIKQYTENHVVVFNKGRYYKINTQDAFGRTLSAAEFQDQLKLILEDSNPPQPGEEKMAALTGTKRDHWHQVRNTHFLCNEVNAESLAIIESAVFHLVLEDETYDFDPENPNGDLNRIGKVLLCGKNGTNRWFDKSFNIIVFKNGYWGFNAEHAFADAPVLGMTLERILIRDANNYDVVGNCLGKRVLPAQRPVRLNFQITKDAMAEIEKAYNECKERTEDVDLYLTNFTGFGKQHISKVLKTSPDAFVQCVLQIAQFLDQGKFVQTYESAMTRLYKNGRTETIRSCTQANTEFVKKLVERST